MASMYTATTEIPKHVRLDDEVQKLAGKLQRDDQLVELLHDSEVDYHKKIFSIAQKLRQQFTVQDPLKQVAVIHLLNEVYQFAPVCPHHKLNQHERDPRLYQMRCWNLDTICDGLLDHRICAVYQEEMKLQKAAQFGPKKKP